VPNAAWRLAVAKRLRHHPLVVNTSPADPITFTDFDRVDIRVGRIVRADPFPEARKPAYKLLIDFGHDLGTRTSSAQLTRRYEKAELEGRLVVAVVNFPPRQIGPFMSQVLTLGVPDAEGAVVLLVPDKDVPVGGRMF
jgi:tRNA-binding protein